MSKSRITTDCIYFRELYVSSEQTKCVLSPLVGLPFVCGVQDRICPKLIEKGTKCMKAFRDFLDPMDILQNGGPLIPIIDGFGGFGELLSDPLPINVGSCLAIETVAFTCAYLSTSCQSVETDPWPVINMLLEMTDLGGLISDGMGCGSNQTFCVYSLCCINETQHCDDSSPICGTKISADSQYNPLTGRSCASGFYFCLLAVGCVPDSVPCTMKQFVTGLDKNNAAPLGGKWSHSYCPYTKTCDATNDRCLLLEALTKIVRKLPVRLCDNPREDEFCLMSGSCVKKGSPCHIQQFDFKDIEMFNVTGM